MIEFAASRKSDTSASVRLRASIGYQALVAGPPAK